MRVESSMPIRVKLGAVNNIFRRIVTAAEHLHLSTKTEAEKLRKQYPRLTDPYLMFSGIYNFSGLLDSCSFIGTKNIFNPSIF
jgi:Ras family protein T1